MSDDLKELYAEYNRKYFRNSLPECDITWAPLPKTLFGQYFGPTYVPANPAKKTDEREAHLIEIARWSKPFRSLWKFTLLHEMVHVKLRYDLGDFHGRKFQKEMKRLANMGAFNKLW